jgi:hypothetical protein
MICWDTNEYIKGTPGGLWGHKRLHEKLLGMICWDTNDNMKSYSWWFVRTQTTAASFFYNKMLRETRSIQLILHRLAHFPLLRYKFIYIYLQQQHKQ